jgi:ABC-type sugar transport system ATPase subunit
VTEPSASGSTAFYRQAVKVGKAVYWGGRILIFDEPTNNLSVMQERTLIDLIRRYRDAHHVAVIVISLNTGRLFELVDRFVVLRNGQIVGQKRKLETTPNDIVTMMTGMTP